MPATVTEDVVLTKVHREAGQLMWVGWALAIIGAFSLILPMVTGVAATRYLGWALVIAGAALLGRAFWLRHDGPFFTALAFGALSLASGVFVVNRPLGGEIAVALCLGAVFLIQGGFEIALALQTRPLPGWSWMLVSALASIAMAGVILMASRDLSLMALGAVIGVNFLSSGLAFLTIGAAARSEIGIR
jgi:uncharacterized membrane protein HdeD (DUF308 family)